MQRTGANVAEAIAHVTPAARRRDAEALLALFAEVAGREPEMWTGGIIGFGACHYRYPTGTEGDSPILGFAPRKRASTVYLLDGVDAHTEQLTMLGEHSTGVGCLYLPDLAKLDVEVLRSILASSFEHVQAEKTSYGSLTVID